MKISDGEFYWGSYRIYTHNPGRPLLLNYAKYVRPAIQNLHPLPYFSSWLKSTLLPYFVQMILVPFYLVWQILHRFTLFSKDECCFPIVWKTLYQINTVLTKFYLNDLSTQYPLSYTCIRI